MKVYVIGTGDQTKIGVSAAPQRRLRKLQAANPTPLQLEAIITCKSRIAARAVESMLLRRFHPHRVNGEWFNIHSNAVLSFLNDAALLAGLTHQIEFVNVSDKRRVVSKRAMVSQRILEYFRDNPADFDLPCRKLAQQLGVGKTTVADVRRALCSFPT